jgi:hypothetical protein
MPPESLTRRYSSPAPSAISRMVSRSRASAQAPSSPSPIAQMVQAVRQGQTGPFQGRFAGRKAPGTGPIASQIKGGTLGIKAGVSGDLSVRETAGGYTYPEIPAQLEQGIPDYYRKSRSSRGLPALPAASGQLARKIGRYVANMPNDPDNRGSIEATIAQVLIAAAQAAESAGDSANAARLAEIAGMWVKRVTRAGGQAPTIDPDKPLSGVHFEYGYLSAPDASVFSTGLTNHQLASMAAVGVGVVYGRESKSIARGGVCGAIAYVLASGALSVFRRQD